MTGVRTSEREAYSHPFRMGRYERSSGMSGKYDNVRRLWEDQVTGFFLGPPLHGLIERRKNQGKGLRILDLGCGAGDGYDLITGIGPYRRGDTCSGRTAFVPPEAVDEYVGLDINEDLLAEGARRHAGVGNVSFLKADLSRGLPGEILRGWESFDLYFTSYAMLSHFSDGQFARILKDTCEHAADGALFVGDWLGHYSYEWPMAWRQVPTPDYLMDYRMSYLYTPEERLEAGLPAFPLRLMTPGEVLRLVRQTSRECGRTIRPLSAFDRSILVGRHTDTGEYNPGLPALRTLVNSMFERGRRTDIEDLLVEYVPKPGFARLNRFHRLFFTATNWLVGCALELFDHQTGSRMAPLASLDVPEPVRSRLAEAADGIRSVVSGLDWGSCEDARADKLEPALAYGLRHLEIMLQEGLGAGHSLGVIFQLTR